MSFSISGSPSNEQVVEAANVYVKASKRQRDLFKTCASQFSESNQEEKKPNPRILPRIIKQPKKKIFPFLSDIETIIFVSDKAGIGSVLMSAHLKLCERQIRRVLVRACEKVEEQKMSGNVRSDMYMEANQSKEVITYDKDPLHDSGSCSDVSDVGIYHQGILPEKDFEAQEGCDS